MKNRQFHFKIIDEQSGKCPITNRPATLIKGVSSPKDPDIVVEKEHEGDFTLYNVKIGDKEMADKCLVTFIGHRGGRLQLDLVVY